jgi:replication-associated recombination protein RarA
MPPALQETTFYEPTDRGFELRLKERLEWLKKRRAESASGE